MHQPGLEPGSCAWKAHILTTVLLVLKFHPLVSIQRPDGYEPSALPLRQDELVD